MYKFIISLLMLVSFKSGQALDPRLNQLLNSQGIDVNNVKNPINSQVQTLFLEKLMVQAQLHLQILMFKN